MSSSSVTKKTAERIEYLVRIIPPLLKKIPEADFSYKPRPEKWSKKQIMGHLIDSATNNHHRFIRARYENVPFISYNQDEWNRLTFYNDMKSEDVIGLWALYNSFLAEIIKKILPAELERKCQTGDKEPLTLGFIIEDYVVHLEHHLRQVVNYD